MAIPPRPIEDGVSLPIDDETPRPIEDGVSLPIDDETDQINKE